MNDHDLELISQYIDGELPSQEAHALRKRLLAEPDLRASLERMQAVNDSVQMAFAGTEAVPAGVAAMLTRSGRSGWVGGAIAASLVAATALIMAPDWRSSPDSGELPVLAADVGDVLDITASSADSWHSLADGRQVRALLSFRSIEGGWCREYFLANANSAQRGVACREAGAWHSRVQVEQTLPGSAADYRPAASSDVDAVASFVARYADGDALSLTDEAAVIAGRWQ